MCEHAANAAPTSVRFRLEIGGIVQGVGFRPFVARTAQSLGLAGWVANHAAGVVVEVEGAADAIAAFGAALRKDHPAPARIDEVCELALPASGERGFAIASSLTDEAPIPSLQPDSVICPSCLAELSDPSSRRFRYPFISCAECGPRYSITKALPFDRARTALDEFPLCAECSAEYVNPANRRFDAQTIGCACCGPLLSLLDSDGRELSTGEAALEGGIKMLRQGKILALKGIGGFQLLADARNETAIAELRARKARPAKPLAVMVADLRALRALCTPTIAEEALISSSAGPIVLIDARPGALPEAIAPGCPRHGVMLPASGLHALIADDFGAPLVVSSGNRAGEPIAIDNAAALRELSGIADAFLVHNRRVIARLDDSVTQIAAGSPQVLRRARGYVPLALSLATQADELALGGQQKNTIAQGLGPVAMLSAHHGELEHAATFAAFKAACSRLSRLYHCPPRRILIDAHPDYMSSVFGMKLAQEKHLFLTAIWHHVAHVHAVIAEHALELPVLGIAWDGMGLGERQALLGGEAFRVTPEASLHCASLQPFPLPGGEAAIREPRRAALGLLYAAEGPSALHQPALALLFDDTALVVLETMLAKGINSPTCHSIGRLFDAVSALLGLCAISRYEGDAAMQLQFAAETAQREGVATPDLAFKLEGGTINWQAALNTLLTEKAQGRPTAALALGFHRALAALCVELAQTQALTDVVLAGGCFQNRLLLALCIAALRKAGLRAHWACKIPSNDGGLALGQLGAAHYGHVAWTRNYSEEAS